jgi:energy-coupling factor transporter ATP-binding protein EcfA2
MITFEQVSYRYPGAARLALKDVSLQLPEGGFTLVVGPSGAGKSTLLRCINGLVPHFSGGVLEGTITVDGLEPVRATPQVLSRNVGFVFQDPEAQFVVDRVEDEIAFVLENAALPRQEMRVRVEESLDLLDLVPLRERRLETLSGGERQRVAIAAALALRPGILVLDEPTSQLDPKSAEDVLHALARLNSDLGLSIVLAEHRLERVLPFTDHLVYLSEGGSLAASGPPREVLGQLELVPPLAALGKALGWDPLPLTVKEGRRFASGQVCKFASRQVGKFAGGRRGARVGRGEGEPYLVAREVEAGYNGRAVLQGIDLEVWPGEIVVLMGRNGSGKTTLLKSIVGLLRPRRGDLRVAGEEVAGREVAEVCRQVGYLPQDPNALLFADTVLEELFITLRNHGLEGDSPVAPTALLERLGLADKEGDYPRDLSAGERQRVALGAITVTQPGALLLDEPTRGLDYAAKEGLVELLRGWREQGMAILLVTHDVELAAAAADRVVLLSQGEIIAQGDPAQVLGASPLFAPQVARLFPGRGWLTVEEALEGLGDERRRTMDDGRPLTDDG